MKQSRVERSWEPIRIGDTYCSPACGRGCKWSAYQTCVRKANALAKRLGSNWKTARPGESRMVLGSRKWSV